MQKTEARLCHFFVDFFFFSSIYLPPPPSKAMSTDAAAAMRMAEQEMEYRVELFNK